MLPDEFRDRLLAYQRPTRELILEAGDPGAMPLTKIGGVPWWPAAQPRPHCRDGHAMSFVFQVRMSDAPALEAYRDTLLSFHYCLECSNCGNMSWGWENPGKTVGYNVALLPVADDMQVDGVIAEAIVEPYTVRFRDVFEVPLPDDLDIHFSELPDDYPSRVADLDENIYPGVIQVARSKVGGWPHWVQNNAWPPARGRESVEFLGQLDWMLCPRSPWCNGGDAYLFIQPIASELALQTT